MATLKRGARFLRTPKDARAWRDEVRRVVVPRDYIKVSLRAPNGSTEHFWLRVVESQRRGGPWKAKVANKLVLTKAHGVGSKDTLLVHARDLQGFIAGKGRKPYADDPGTRTKNPARCAPRGEITTSERKKLPAWAFGLPKEEKYPLYKPDANDKPIPSAQHAANAKARASGQFNRGKLSARKRDQIFRRADKVLAMCRTENPEDFAADWRRLKHAPIRLQNIDAGEFGDALELEGGGHRLRWKRGQPFLWDPRQKALIILMGAKRRPGGYDDAKTADAYRRFMGREARRLATDRMAPMQHGVWRSAPARRFDYWSDKFRRQNREYTHGFTSNVRVYRGGGSKPPWIFVLKGGSLNVTSQGIVG